MKYLKAFQKNKIMLLKTFLFLYIFICCLPKWLNYMSTERFSQIDVAHGDIIFYGRDSCPYCVKQKKLLEKVPDLNEKIEHIDTGSEDGSKKFAKIGGEGVPHFECKSTGKSSTGYKEVPDLLSSLGLS